MNLWFRLIGYLLTLFWKAQLEPPFGVSIVNFRVWPTDLDLNLHMNNGRYFTIMDFGRLDLIARTGLWRAVMSNGWTPVLSSTVMRFRRELRCFAPYRLMTRICAWTDSQVVMEHSFVRRSGEREGELAARGLVSVGLYDHKAKAFVSIDRLMQEIGIDTVSPDPSPEVAAFLQANEALRAATAAPASPR